MSAYVAAREVDPTNEYILGNIGLTHMKKGNYEKCVEFTKLALDRVQGFMNDTKMFSKDNRFEVKLLLRRAASLEKIGEIEGAKKDLDRCVQLEPNNKEA